MWRRASNGVAAAQPSGRAIMYAVGPGEARCVLALLANTERVMQDGASVDEPTVEAAAALAIPRQLESHDRAVSAIDECVEARVVRAARGESAPRTADEEHLRQCVLREIDARLALSRAVEKCKQSRRSDILDKTIRIALRACNEGVSLRDACSVYSNTVALEARPDFRSANVRRADAIEDRAANLLTDAAKFAAAARALRSEAKRFKRAAAVSKARSHKRSRSSPVILYCGLPLAETPGTRVPVRADVPVELQVRGGIQPLLVRQPETEESHASLVARAVAPTRNGGVGAGDGELAFYTWTPPVGPEWALIDARGVTYTRLLAGMVIVPVGAAEWDRVQKNLTLVAPARV